MEQPHARFYRDLPPVVRHPGRRWLLFGALFIVAASLIAVPVLAFTYATHSVPSGWWGGGGRSYGGNLTVFDLHSVLGFGGAFIAGGLVGYALARTWWSTLALYALGFVITLGLGLLPAWFFWVFGVSAGSGVRGLLRRRRVVRASFVGQPG